MWALLKLKVISTPWTIQCEHFWSWKVYLHHGLSNVSTFKVEKYFYTMHGLSNVSTFEVEKYIYTMVYPMWALLKLKSISIPWTIQCEHFWSWKLYLHHGLSMRKSVRKLELLYWKSREQAFISILYRSTDSFHSFSIFYDWWLYSSINNFAWGPDTTFILKYKKAHIGYRDKALKINNTPYKIPDSWTFVTLPISFSSEKVWWSKI